VESHLVMGCTFMGLSQQAHSGVICKAGNRTVEQRIEDKSILC
jgi:hypothetical protein